jgi:DNA-binding LacI/PurR family transcriptional regulator
VREGALYRRQGKGTFVAESRPLPAPKRLVGVLLPAAADLNTNHFHMELLKGIRSALDPGQMDLIFCAPSQTFSEALSDTPLSGGLLVTPTLDQQGDALELQRRIPVVAVSSHFEGGEIPYVALDTVRGACQAVEHLLGRGHTRIAYVTGGSPRTCTAERQEGYERALKASGVAPTPELVIRVDHFDERGGEAAAGALIRLSPAPTAAFAANDLMAMGLVRGLQSLGKAVPDDIAVVGFDDLAPSRYTQPALTTVGGSLQETGRAAVALLDELIESPGGGHGPTILPTRLIVRESG